MDKQAISLKEWYMLPANIQQFINLWQEKHGLEPTVTPNLIQVLQLHRAVCRSFHKESSDMNASPDSQNRDVHLEVDGTFYNYTIQGEEFHVAWQGEQLIDIAWYELVQGIKKRLTLTVI